MTRTPQQSGRLSELLRSEGAEVVVTPLIRFGPPSNPAALAARLSDLRGLDWLLLTSPQAVGALFAALSAANLTGAALADLKLAAVGPGTAAALAQHGLRPDFVPSAATALHLAAELPQARAVLHLTSQQSEDALARGLATRGTEYHRLELYRTEGADLSPAQLEQLRRAGVVTLASGSATRQLVALLGTAPRVAAMGIQTAEAARHAGLTDIFLAPTPTLEGLVEAVIQAAQRG